MLKFSITESLSPRVTGGLLLLLLLLYYNLAFFSFTLVIGLAFILGYAVAISLIEKVSLSPSLSLSGLRQLGVHGLWRIHPPFLSMAEDHDGGEHTIGRILPLIGNRFTQEVSQSLHMGKPLVVRNEGQLELLIDYIPRGRGSPLPLNSGAVLRKQEVEI